jgi:hypothetical protein
MGGHWDAELKGIGRVKITCPPYLRNLARKPGKRVKRMEKDECLEQYPWWIVLVSNLVSFGIYAIGAYIIYQAGAVWLAAYLLGVLVLEARLLKKSCVNCYYYGKMCAFGRGKICSLLFKKGEPDKFIKRQISFKDMLPEMLVSMVPLLVGVALLIMNFDFLMLGLVVLLIILSSAGNGCVRGSLACKHCKQGKIGCPALKLLGKKK